MTPIHLTLSAPSGKLGTCASRFWGNPALPKGFGYPMYTDDGGDEYPYLFVCQINLAEVAPYDTQQRLPHKGLLSFFAKIDHYLGVFDSLDFIGGSISSTDDVCVLYFPEVGTPGPHEGFEEMVLVDADEQPLNPSELCIRFSARPAEPYAEEHALFAHPTHREWETWDHPFEHWQILLQIDSCEGADFQLNFMDCGVLDFLIDPNDLAAADFSKVRGIVLST